MKSEQGDSGERASAFHFKTLRPRKGLSVLMQEETLSPYQGCKVSHYSISVRSEVGS